MSSTQSQVDLAFLAATLDELEKQLKGISDSVARAKPSADEFSVLENICHLRDLEREGYAVRINRILAEQRPALENFDGARVAAERHYNQEGLSQALESFKLARRGNLLILKSLSPSQWEREGELEGVGVITPTTLVSMMREHDAGHLRELEPLLREQRTIGDKTEAT